MAEYPERKMCILGKDDPLKIFLTPITAVMSQENVVWNKDVVEEQVGQVSCLVEILNSESTSCQFE
jgi:hypothetical protein